MSFFDDIRRCAATGIKYGYSIVLFGGEAVYMNGITRVLEIGPERMAFASEKRIIAITGSDMAVSELEKDSVMIKGHIKNIGEG